jgi:CBS domain-containing protein
MHWRVLGQGVTGLPVVNEEGAVVDNISTRDLRVLQHLLGAVIRTAGGTHRRWFVGAQGIKYDAKMLWRLWESVAFFKRRIVESDQKVHEHKSDACATRCPSFNNNIQTLVLQAPADVVYVLNSDTLETVVQKLAEHHIHRVFVVDDELHKRPVRVLSQCDILQNVLRT